MIRLLVVDDNVGMTNVISEYFKGDSTIKINYIAHDGEEAVNMIKEHDDIDMILLDIIMPKKDGVYVLEYLKDNSIDTKVIVETSYDSDEMIKIVGNLGASYFITKPFELEDLKSRILTLKDAKIFNSNKLIDFAGKDIENQISKLLHELGIPSHIKGYQYIRDGIMLICNDPSYVGSITKLLYPTLAKRHSTTSSRVERAMRHAIEVGWTRSDWKITEDLFGQSVDFDRTKPTNSEFLVTIADKIRLESNVKI